MPRIENSLELFTEKLLSGAAVSVTKDGHWHVENWFIRLVRWIFDLTESRVRNVVSCVKDIFQKYELEAYTLRDTAEERKKKITQLLDAARAAKAAISCFSSKKAKKVEKALKSVVVSLKYRVGSELCGYDKTAEAAPEVFERVSVLAQKYKRSLWNLEKKLHEIDRKSLRDLACYPKFVRLLEKDPALQNNFFGYSIRYLTPSELIVEFPALTNKLKRCHMLGIIGRFSYENPLQIEVREEEGITKKAVTVPFDGVRVNLLNKEDRIKFAGGFVERISDVFNDLKKNTNTPGSYNFFSKIGFTKWSAHKLAYWNKDKGGWEQIDINKPCWWRQLPPYEVISEDCLKARYNIAELKNEDEYIIVTMSARQSNKFRIDDCHGYEVVCERRDDGMFQIYPFGKYPKESPHTSCQKKGFVTNTVYADIVYPDPNPAYAPFREFAAYPDKAGRGDGFKYFEEIKKDIEKCRKGNLVFQLPFENCAYTAFEHKVNVFGKKWEGGKIPNLFYTHVLDTGANNPILDFLIKKYRKSPNFMQKPLVHITHSLLCSSRGVWIEENGKRVFKSAKNSSFAKGLTYKENGKEYSGKHHTCSPSHLHKRILNGEVKGKIWSGFYTMQQ